MNEVKANKIIHRAADRGFADHGWLQSHHSFSFANYHDPKKTHFGLLRVLNDDVVAPAQGFGTHPHDNMEIVTIPLKGAVKHKDNVGHEGVINTGDVQIMSAGKGLMHSEFNASDKEPVNFFQIWVFPKVRNIEPHYDQRTFNETGRNNNFQLLVSPGKEDGTLWINQDAWFSLGKFSAGKKISYPVKKEGNGVYIMVVSGEVEVEGEKLKQRDAIGIWDSQKVNMEASSDAELLVLDIPMN